MSPPDPSIDGLSVVIPTLNEAGSVKELVQRIDRALADQSFPYELIFIDDHSDDATRKVLAGLSAHYPLTVQLKRGERGKAFSLLEGFELAKYTLLAIIDADLQYPPEALPKMVKQIQAGHNVVVANRRVSKESWLRTLSSDSFSLLFTRLLHGLQCDVQAGLKMFRRKVLDEMELKPTPWTFDLAFLINARTAGHSIGTVDITFEERTYGDSKVRLLRASLEIGLNALLLKFRRRKLVTVAPVGPSTMLGAGIAKKGRRFITHTTLDHRVSALTTFTNAQKFVFVLAAVVLLFSLYWQPLVTGVVVMAAITAVYFLDAVFNLYVVRKSLTSDPALSFSDDEIAAIDDRTLPVYSILCPLYREANVIEGFVEAIEKLDWPKRRLDVQLLLEEDDKETIAAAKSLQLPPYVRVVVVPDSQPKTKPKACNYGLGLAHGEYVVIYDAEDIPDPQQLKKAYLAWQRVPRAVQCLQAKLNYFNSGQNLLTRLFTAEYSQWFDVMLPGMQGINTSIPLGGTSNHFRTEKLRELGAWDPFNVTEDCDLGARLFKQGYRTAIIDSVTLEEANSQVGNWIRQRSRWLKGYMQTYLVHMRRPVAFVRQHGWHALAFQFIVGGKVAFMVINPLLWLATISYFAAYALVGPAIEAIYPGPILLIGAASLIGGNFLYLYYYMIGCAARGHWRLVKYVYLMPFYWVLTSAAAYLAFYQLLTRPHYWEKTKHGLHRRRAAGVRTRAAAPKPQPAPALAPAPARSAGHASPAAVGGGLLSSGGMLVGAMVISNATNFGFNAWLGRVLDFGEIGLIVFINSLWQMAVLVLGALSSTVNHRSAYLAAQQKMAAAVSFWKSTARAALLICAAVTGLWLSAAAGLAGFFNVSDPLPLLLFAPIFTFGVIAFTNQGWLHGNLRFKALAALFLIESTSKFLIAAVLVWLGLSAWAYLAIPLSVGLMAAASLALTRQGAGRETAPAGIRFPHRFFSASLLTTASAVAWLNIDLVLAKHFLEPDMAGQYALLSLVGKMIYFLGALPNIFMISLVSRHVGLQRNPAVVFRYLLASTVLLTGIGWVLLGPAGSLTVPYLFGAKAQAIVPWLLAYTLAIGLFTITNSIVTYHLARKRYWYPALLLIISMFMVVGIVGSHDGIGDIVGVLLNVSLAGFVAVATLHLLNVAGSFAYRGAAALRRMWRQVTAPREAGSGMRILIFNWRDLQHTMAGGAEVYIQRMAEDWAARGHQVTLFSGNDGRSPRRERVRGVDVYRRGGFYLVYVWAALYYLFKFRGRFDAIIDCHNGIPFFAPLYSRTPVFCLMHHVHQEVFRRSLVWPLAVLARWLERVAMPLVYRRVPIITISKSSKQEMEAMGLGRAGINIVHPGINLGDLSPGAKSKNPTVLYLGRLAPYKSVDVLLRAFKVVLKSSPTAQLVIAGGGEDDAYLRNLALKLRLGSRIKFAGHVTEEQKAELLRRAWVAVNPSFMEGWGITTIEANASGTPVVASDVSGLRDSVKHNETGLLVPHGDVRALASGLAALLGNRHLRGRMSRQAIEWAQRFSFDKSSRLFLALITAELSRRENMRSGRRGRLWRRGMARLRGAFISLAARRIRQAEAAVGSDT